MQVVRHLLVMRADRMFISVLRGLALKVLRAPFCFGFAAGVGFAAVAVHRRRGAFNFLGYALVRPWPDGSDGPSPNQGRSPGIVWRLLAGQSPRLTSGGKAEPNMAQGFWGKAVHR